MIWYPVVLEMRYENEKECRKSQEEAKDQRYEPFFFTDLNGGLERGSVGREEADIQKPPRNTDKTYKTPSKKLWSNDNLLIKGAAQGNHMETPLRSIVTPRM